MSKLKEHEKINHNCPQSIKHSLSIWTKNKVFEINAS